MEQQYVGDATGSQSALDLDAAAAARRWAGSGAAGLSGRPNGDPLAVPLGLVDGVVAISTEIAARSSQIGSTVAVDGLALLGERAAAAGLSRRGSTSCGGATQLLAAADGEIVLSLARPHDIESIPAWLECPALPAELDELWPAIVSLVAHRSQRELGERAALLGLPFASVGEVERSGRSPARMTHIAAHIRPTRREPLVIDLSSLWAGPLCADLLGRAGCRVVKVESSGRPDGARLGPSAFYDILHGGHESVALDFTADADRAALRSLLADADVVIEASRPRALGAMGLDRTSIDGPAVWISITGHGRDGGAGDRVAFGDDAAAAGGLVTGDEIGSCFCVDAVADPLTGLTAAAAAMRALADGGRWTIDLALSEVAASFASGPPVDVDPATIVAPRARPVVAVAPPMGTHTDQVLREFGIRR